MKFTEKCQTFVPYQDVATTDLGGGLTRRVLAYTNNQMCVENTFTKGAVGAVHSHPHEQITYVVSGLFTFDLDGTVYTIAPGDTIVVPPDVPHGTGCIEAGALMDFFTPMRADFV